MCRPDTLTAVDFARSAKITAKKLKIELVIYLSGKILYKNIGQNIGQKCQ
jgi:hypothetical protein